MTYGVIGMLLRCRDPKEPGFAPELVPLDEAPSFDALPDLASINFRNWSLFMVADMPRCDKKLLQQ